MAKLRDAGLFGRIEPGEERGIPAVKAWNAFLSGTDQSPEDRMMIMRTPLGRILTTAGNEAARVVVLRARKSAGLDPFAGSTEAERVGQKRLIPHNDEMVSEAAKEAARAAADCSTGTAVFLSSSDSIECPKTGKTLFWKGGDVLSPSLMEWDPSANFVPIERWEARQPIRHVEMSFPSGVVLMADWFRIDGFAEGAAYNEDFELPGIGSDLGVDMRTRDHAERLGLGRIQVGNRVPAVVLNGGVIRVGRPNEDREAPGQKIVGTVCCDMWNVTFADREVLADILIAGREKLGLPASREGALADLNAYVAEGEGDVVRIDVEPGKVMHLYTATGTDASKFRKHFRSPQLDPDEMEDLFVISPEPLDVDPEIVEEAGWSWLARPENDPAPSI